MLPFFFDMSLLFGCRIPIEHRPPEEACLVRGAIHPRTLEEDGSPKLVQVLITPSNLDGVYNPSFDVTPAELITAVVTEKGVALRKQGSKDIDLSGVV
jgi:methylthioribose-1-phosphate isomerase